MGKDKDKITLVVKTVKETDETIFDEKVNSLIEDGFWLKKRLAITTEEELHFVAFLEKKVKMAKEEEKMETSSEESLGAQVAK